MWEGYQELSSLKYHTVNAFYFIFNIIFIFIIEQKMYRNIYIHKQSPNVQAMRKNMFLLRKCILLTFEMYMGKDQIVFHCSVVISVNNFFAI